MNHVFRVVWNATIGCWVAVSELTKAKGKASRSKSVSGVSAGLLFLSSAMAYATAPVAIDLDMYFNGQGITVLSGGGGTGCMIGVGIAGCNAAPKTDKVTYTNFHTQGGDGSGGGAGLGGVFFVNAGAALNLSNVQFTGNVVEGGNGGGTPDVRLQSANIALVQRQANVVAFSAFNVVPVIGGDGKSISTIDIGSNTTPLKVGQQVSLDGTTGTARISAINGSIVTLDSALTLGNTSVKTLTGSMSVSASSSTSVITGQALTDLGQGGRIEMGAVVQGAGIPYGTVVTDVQRDSSNNITSVVLSKAVTGTISPASLTFVSTPKLNASQFVVGPGNTIQLSAASLGLSVGMTLTGTGIASGTVVTAINGDQVTLSKPLPQNVLGFSSVAKIGQAGGNTILLASPDARIQIGGTISGDGIPAGTTIQNYNPATGLITLSNTLTADMQDKASIVTSAIQSQSGSSITLASVSGLQVGMTVTGSGIPDGAKIVAINGNQVTFDQALTGTVQGFVANSPLNVGGSLNGLKPAGIPGTNGKNGNDANSVLPYLTDGEGLAGFSGQDANN
ncbi:ESPR domain-containing protein [Laribacter hongkongensis]|uniref:ESPR domain-containing protein n=2 Tax=Laribacter hongkongensis TaxID=168471 RepID=UPI001EFCDCF4|nr:ESPR domain-containing protein [Laribacter hongkongensis]MCG8991100.1 ESPR domain-containing protein [Laribacter hongkongensis]MCG9001111.1 ESPR domain-containing protein [Laribacter hongkongensis]MCG9006152.1 ESPR domain-containing protein [Laribacter hongkongensis]